MEKIKHQRSDTERLVECLVRLRHLERLSLGSEEIHTIRRELEQIVGPTVMRATAARLLNVSQTALDRWITAGDIPVVVTPIGRREVPLRALVDLIEAVQECSNTGDNRHPLASVLQARRSAAERLDIRKIIPDRYRRDREDNHALIGLAYHRAVAMRLDPQTIEDARERLARWRYEGKIDSRYADQWETILSWSPTRIARLIEQDSQRSNDLRQCSPFAGTLSEPERYRVLAAVGESSCFL